MEIILLIDGLSINYQEDKAGLESRSGQSHHLKK